MDHPVISAVAISAGTYNAIYNSISLAVAAMLAATLFFFFSRSQVGFKYRPALLVSALVTAIACYHYLRIFNSWVEAHAVVTEADGTITYHLTNVAFNDAYRYMDWILTVPLLLVELVAVLGLSKIESRGLLSKLAFAAFLMIALGYPGEIIKDNTPLRAFWGTMSTIPFIYILVVLFKQLNESIAHQPEAVAPLVRGARLLTLASWGFYPLAYMIPMLGSVSAQGSELGVQIGYTVADILSKVGLGTFIYFIAAAKTENDARTGANPFEPDYGVAASPA